MKIWLFSAIVLRKLALKGRFFVALFSIFKMNSDLESNEEFILPNKSPKKRSNSSPSTPKVEDEKFDLPLDVQVSLQKVLSLAEYDSNEILIKYKNRVLDEKAYEENKCC